MSARKHPETICVQPCAVAYRCCKLVNKDSSQIVCHVLCTDRCSVKIVTNRLLTVVHLLVKGGSTCISSYNKTPERLFAAEHSSKSSSSAISSSISRFRRIPDWEGSRLQLQSWAFLSWHKNTHCAFLVAFHRPITLGFTTLTATVTLTVTFCR